MIGPTQIHIWNLKIYYKKCKQRKDNLLWENEVMSGEKKEWCTANFGGVIF